MVFALKHVPDDEADDIRALLTENEIDFYETSAGRWQISLAAIWVRNDEDFVRARTLINADQQQRQQQYQPAQRGNLLVGILSHIWRNPIESIFVIIALAFVVGLSVLPFTL